jgi:hypothetical protein
MILIVLTPQHLTYETVELNLEMYRGQLQEMLQKHQENLPFGVMNFFAPHLRMYRMGKLLLL